LYFIVSDLERRYPPAYHERKRSLDVWSAIMNNDVLLLYWFVLGWNYPKGFYSGYWRRGAAS